MSPAGEVQVEVGFWPIGLRGFHDEFDRRYEVSVILSIVRAPDESHCLIPELRLALQRRLHASIRMAASGPGCVKTHTPF